MILTDTGPLLALLDADDVHHTRCLATARRLPATPLLTTWPCFTEAMYLLGAVGGYAYQAKLWALLSSARLVLHDLTDTEVARMSELMRIYKDTPMDMADASLVAVAESQMFTQIFFLDSHFYVYRLNDGNVLAIMP